MEHYSRHGSRWLIGEGDYTKPVEKLEAAERNGKLIPWGEDAFQTSWDEHRSEGSLGRLSDKGQFTTRV